MEEIRHDEKGEAGSEPNFSESGHGEEWRVGHHREAGRAEGVWLKRDIMRYDTSFPFPLDLWILLGRAFIIIIIIITIIIIFQFIDFRM